MGRITTVSANATSAWLRSAWWDLGCLAFCWVPFYLWVVYGLGLDGGWGSTATAALGLATVVALAITYVHRHYTFVLVYGDRGTFSRRARDFIVAPILTFAIVGGGRAFKGADLGVGISPWMLVLVTVGVWNIWHSIMQRYGILRIYAGRSGQGLEERAHGKRDLALLWSCVLLIAALVVVFRAESFAGHKNAKLLLRVLGPLLKGPAPWVILTGSVGITLAAFLRWLRYERRAELSLAERAPRLLFLASTIALLGVFVVHGPIIGYLCFGVAHALEYVAFVHHFGERKFARDPQNRGFVARWMRRPWVFGVLLSGGLLLLFTLLVDHRRGDVYLVYYMGTSLLHFLFDGWIWKVRKPHVGGHLGVKGAAVRSS